MRKLKAEGLKFTGKRQETVAYFVRNEKKYLSAKEVFEYVRTTFPNVSYDTIYRTLSTLLEHGIIEHMEFSDDAAKYRLKCHDEHHHHLICTRCGTTIPVNECPMDDLLTKIQHFKVLDHRFEIYGYCEQCAASV